MQTSLKTFCYTSPIGDLYLSHHGNALYHCDFSIPKNLYELLDHPDSFLKKVTNQLDQYFAGKRQSFDLPLFYDGSIFQQQVWQKLCTIPYGKTISYRDLAHLVGNPKAFRAVGSANGKNSLAIIIPCHRVIQHNGQLGGYAGGLDRKKFLLELEQKTCTMAKTSD